jgi:hypothetical protein
VLASLTEDSQSYFRHAKSMAAFSFLLFSFGLVRLNLQEWVKNG